MEDFDIRKQRYDKEQEFEKALRPLAFGDFSGQEKIIENLRVFVEAAKMRGESLDHVLLHGPPGLGKTTLSNIIANELGVGFKITSGPVLDKPGDLAGILTSLEPNDVLFIDEIHRLSPVVEEYLYSAMEDFRIDIMIDKGPSARSIQLDLNPFTLVGATTRSGLLTSPLRARFGINCHLEYFEPYRATLCFDSASSLYGRGGCGDCHAQPWDTSYCQCPFAPCPRFCPSERKRAHYNRDCPCRSRSSEYRPVRSR